MASRKAGGLLLRVGEASHFIPASVALRVAPQPVITPVPGSPSELVGVALQEGTIVPVLALGPTRRSMVVCRWSGELVGLVGADDLETGVFDAASDPPDAVEHAGRLYPLLDVSAICVAVQRAARRGPWAG